MSDLASPPVQNSGSFSQTPAFADALQRAKQIAAKINPGAAPSLGQKRPFEGEDMDGMGGPDGKRPAGMPDPYGAQMAAMRDGMPGGPPMGMVGPPMGAPGGPPLGLPGGMESEDVKVPDRMVGLIIGRGGESINRLQSESGAKIQMSPHCMDGSNERICSITGARGAIERAKELIGEIINSRAGERDGPGGGGGGMAGIPQMGEPGPGQTTSEMMVPSSKVGLIIGKGGETIKQLQDQSGSKMVVIQDGHYANAPEKPLRITGDSKQIDRAKQLVFDLMAEKDNYNSGGGRFNRGYGGSSQEVIVPQAAVGVVIGKGGEMIKKVQSDTGANIQFQPNVSGRNERVAVVSGSPDQIEHAKVIIQELIESVMKRDQMGGGGRNGGWGGGGGGGGGYGRQMGGRDGKQEVRVPVPAERCGIVIGKQGETIKGINAQTGAHCEMDRNDQSDPTQRFFTIRGTPEQVEHARRLISEKAGIPMGGPGGPGPYGGPGGYPAPGGWGGPAGGPGGYGPGPAQPAPGVWGGGNDHYGAPYYGGPQPPQQPAAPGGAPGGGMPQAQPQPTAAPQQQGQQQDYSAAWIEYYRSMGMHREADAIEQQAKANKAAAAPAPAATPASAAQPAQNGGGQPDYSAAWVEYYRTQGMIAEAEKLEQQIKQQKSQQAAAAPAAGYGQPAAAPQPAAGQQYGSFAPGGGYGGGAPGYGQPAYGGYPGAGDN